MKLILSVTFGLLVIITSYFIMEEYYKNQPIWVEQAVYLQWPSIQFLYLQEKVGFINALFEISREGGRHLLQIALLGLFLPKLLGWIHAHLILTFISLVIFLYIFSLTIYFKTRKLSSVIVSLVLFLSIKDLVSSKWGIGTGFADYHSFFFLSAGILCLINAFSRSSLWWIRLFAVFLTLSIFSRTTALFYAGVISLPILIFYFYKQYQKDSSLKSLFSLFLNIFIPLLPVFIVALIQLPFLLWYYRSPNAWNLREPLSISLFSILNLFSNYVGNIFLVTCGFFLLVSLFKKSFRLAQDNLFYVWWIFSFIGLLLINGYVSDVPKEVMYIIPPILFLTISPVFVDKIAESDIFKKVTVVLLALSIISFINNVSFNLKQAKRVEDGILKEKQTQIEMAEFLAKMPRDTIWQSYTIPDWGIPVSLLTYYRYKNFQKSINVLFHNKRSYWEARYPDMELSQIKEKLYSQTVKCVKIAIILSNPELKPSGMEDYSFSIASYISKRIKSDSNWLYLDSISGQPSIDKLDAYLNRNDIQKCDIKSAI